MAASVASVSAERPKPLMRVSPSAIAPSRSARCEIDLSPGTRTCPRTAAAGSTLTLGRLWTKSCNEFAPRTRLLGTCPGTVPGHVPKRGVGVGRVSFAVFEHGRDDDAVA